MSIRSIIAVLFNRRSYNTIGIKEVQEIGQQRIIVEVEAPTVYLALEALEGWHARFDVRPERQAAELKDKIDTLMKDGLYGSSDSESGKIVDGGIGPAKPV